MLRWVYKMGTVQDGEDPPVAEVLPELAAQTMKATSAHACRQKEGSYTEGFSLVLNGTKCHSHY